MNKLQEVFGVPKVFLPVIHPVNKESALKAIMCAGDCGAHGVWLINQGMDAVELLKFIDNIWTSTEFKDIWLGINLLGYAPVEALKNALPRPYIRGIWTDDAGIRPDAFASTKAEHMLKAIGDWDGLYFGGTAFKYQRAVSYDQLFDVGRIASSYMDVVTTSGPRTGSAPQLDKIERLRGGVGNTPLAIASGLTPDNVDLFLPVADAFMVATGIESSFGVLDLEKAAAFNREIWDWNEDEKELSQRESAEKKG